jgi:hypothetical protein
VKHVVLLGDSIFDNAAYVRGGEPVIEQLRSTLNPDGRASLLAVDGAITASVTGQLAKLPPDATHLLVSVGGNDALQSSHILNDHPASRPELFAQLANIQCDFAAEYRRMLEAVMAVQRPTIICTIYDAIPGLEREAASALSIFNDSIIRAGVEAGVSILDLRFVCNESRDYSEVSPIEPSEIGGAKIAMAIFNILNRHDFSGTASVIYRS